MLLKLLSNKKMSKSTIPSQKGISSPAIILIGLICALFSIVAFFSIKFILGRWSPSLANSERLFKEMKYDEALAVISKIEPKSNNMSELYTLYGKIWLARAWERQEKENWKNYGANVDDWLSCPEADKAEHYLKKAVQADPDNREARYYTARLYLEKGWFSRAESEYFEVLRLENEYIPAHIDLSALYVKTGNYDLAEKELKTVFSLDPDNPVAAKNLYVLYRFYKEIPESAMVWSNRYLNLDPKGDLDKYFIRENHKQMIERYPEFNLPDSQKWEKQDRRFKPTKRFGG
ncbi:MAG: tetratricopeptide repeat protein [Chitinivibrionales bacterium]|nr:tetratricopeptide repeat protein [Chitinivibrionales bacterium]